MTNSTLAQHTQSLSSEDLPQLKGELAKLLRKSGNDVTVIDEELQLDTLADSGNKAEGVAKKDFTSLQQKYRVDKLLVIEISGLGFIRTYSAYVPTSDPKGWFEGKGYLVSLKNNAYEWYQPVSITKSADRTWDEPPKFPGLTNAYYQALEMGKDSLLKPFADRVVAAAPSQQGTTGIAMVGAQK